MTTTANDTSTLSRWGALRPYVQIARVDHWFKNAFMLLGVVIALFYRPELVAWSSATSMLIAVAATCLICSSNYVLNEVLDAQYDRLHPTKRLRPVAAGLVRPRIALVEFLALGAVGFWAGTAVNTPFVLSLVALWLMACAYNIPPIRTKDVPYLDVLSESVNNPIRLLLGWFALIPDVLPPVSLMLAYWMVGAFLMAAKRLAELRSLGDPAVAARYRHSFAHYNENRLLVSMMFYVSSGALFSGIFIVRYKLELILSVPMIAGFFAYYMSLGLQPDSVVQTPEKLHRKRGFLLYSMLTTGVFVCLMFLQMPWLYELFGVAPQTFGGQVLWRLPGGE